MTSVGLGFCPFEYVPLSMATAQIFFPNSLLPGLTGGPFTTCWLKKLSGEVGAYRNRMGMWNSTIPTPHLPPWGKLASILQLV